MLCCCASDANRRGRARGERLEAGARRRLPPAVFQPHAAVHHVWYRHSGAGNDAVDHHVRVDGLPQPCQQVREGRGKVNRFIYVSLVRVCLMHVLMHFLGGKMRCIFIKTVYFLLPPGFAFRCSLPL